MLSDSIGGAFFRAGKFTQTLTLEFLDVDDRRHFIRETLVYRLDSKQNSSFSDPVPLSLRVLMEKIVNVDVSVNFLEVPSWFHLNLNFSFMLNEI